MPKDKFIAGGFDTWQGYKKAMIAMTKAITGREINDLTDE